MHKFIRANQRIVLAVVGVALMLGFLFQMGRGNTPGTGSDPEVGTADGVAIHGSDLRQAKEEISFLQTQARQYQMMTGEGSGLARAAFSFLGEFGKTQDDKKPLQLVLMRDEATKAGVRANADEVNQYVGLYADSVKLDDRPLLEAVLTDMILINTRFDQVRSYIKIARPAVDQAMAKDAQSVTFTVVPVAADKFLPATTRPADDQIQKQFDQFADVLPGTPSEPANPFGFGYRLPVRYQMQYLQYTPEAVERAVVATAAYDWTGYRPGDLFAALKLTPQIVDKFWEVEANKRYNANKTAYSMPDPFNPAAPPVQLLYLQVHDKVMHEVRQPRIEAMATQLSDYLSATSAADWAAYEKWAVNPTAKDEPVSSVGVKYSSADYLAKLAESAARHDMPVAMTLGKTDGYVTAEQAATAPAYGSPALAEFVKAQGGQFLALPDVHSLSANSVLTKPSGRLTDSKPGETAPVVGPVNTFVRLTDVLPSSKPVDFTPFADQAAKDAQIARAYGLASDEAEKLLSVAPKPEGLKREAVADKLSPFDLPAVKSGSFPPVVPNIDPPLGTSGASFLKQAFATMDHYDPATNPRPAAVVRLPAQRRLFVVQVAGVTADWAAPGQAGAFVQAAGRTRDRLTEDVAGTLDWFTFDRLAVRANYKGSAK